MGKVPYFPQLAIQVNRVVLVRALQRKVMGEKVKQATIKRLAKKADVELEVINELKEKEEISSRLQKELIKYWEMKAQAWNSRKKILDELIGKADTNKRSRFIEMKKREAISIQ